MTTFLPKDNKPDRKALPLAGPGAENVHEIGPHHFLEEFCLLGYNSV
jgi:hypothetical protein